MLNPLKQYSNPQQDFNLNHSAHKTVRPEATRKPNKVGPIWRVPDASHELKKFHFKNYFSISTFITKFFQPFYYKNGEMPDLLV